MTCSQNSGCGLGNLETEHYSADEPELNLPVGRVLSDMDSYVSSQIANAVGDPGSLLYSPYETSYGVVSLLCLVIQHYRVGDGSDDTSRCRIHTNKAYHKIPSIAVLSS